MKFVKTGFLFSVFAGGLLVYPAPAQTVPTPTPELSVVKLSEQLSAVVEKYDVNAGTSTDKRQQAYAKLLEAQRYIYRMLMQRTQSGLAMYADQARTALQASLQYDPGVSESYIALAELTMLTSPDLGEASALCSLATRLNKDSIGGHKFLARILTKQSGFLGPRTDPEIAAKAVQEWKEVTRLDPRNAEAWAVLSELYGRMGKTNDEIDALKRWEAASMSSDAGWFRRIVGGRPEELMPEQAPSRLAFALGKAGRTKEAIEVLAQQLSDDPDNAEIMTQIDEVIGNAKSEIVTQALEPIRQIVATHPGSFTLLEYFASLTAKAGNVDEALGLLRTAGDRLGSKDRPAAANLQITIGDVYSSRGRFVEAAASYEKALSVRGLDAAQTLDPDEKEFVIGVFDKLITAYKRSNKIVEAKSAIDRARKLLGRNDIFADRELVSLYRETGDRGQALAAVRNARAREPQDVTLLRLEATLLMETGQVNEAVDLIKKRIATGKSELPVERLGPSGSMAPRLDDDFSNYIFISQLYNDAGRGAEASAAADQAYGVAGSDERKQIARLMLATSKQTSGQYTEAESILRSILQSSPRNPIALNNLGYFFVERGENLKEALDLIQRAIAIDPTNPSYLDSLGWAYYKLGRTDDAIRKLEEAARLDATSAAIHEHLGDAYRQKGSLEQARTAWQRAVVLTSGPTDMARIKEKLDNAK